MNINIIWKKAKGKTQIAEVGDYKLAIRPVYRQNTRTFLHYTAIINKKVAGLDFYSCIEFAVQPNVREAKKYVIDKLKSILEGGDI